MRFLGHSTVRLRTGGQVVPADPVHPTDVLLVPPGETVEPGRAR